ncbi:head-tail adaptor protein [Micromonospora sp. NPDC047707]|uniref:phage head completion protein n=1 Tax=Micromonospora sp. NPDC047707 TaxID=3154498 RepID=UPI0034539750
MIGHWLNQRLDVWRAQREPDGAGGATTARARVGQVRARITQPRAGEQVEADRAGARHTSDVYLLPRADVRRGDELRPAGAPADSRPYWRVMSTVSPSVAVYRRAAAELIEEEAS